MGRLNLGGTQSGTLSDIQKTALPELPVTPDVDLGAASAAPEAAAPQGGALDQLFASPASTDETVQTVAEGVGAGIEAEIEAEEAGAIPDLKTRVNDTGRVDRWVPTAAANPGIPSDDGGFVARAKNFQELFDTGAINLGLTPTGDVSGAAIAAAHAGNHTSVDPFVVAEAAAAQNPGSLISAINKSGAVQQSFANPEAIAAGQASRISVDSVDPAYMQIGALVTENQMTQLAQGEADVSTPDVEAGAIDEGLKHVAPKQAFNTVSRAQGNAQIGQQIHKEYQRFKNPGRTPEPLSKEEATTLGHAFKALYSAANPDMVKPIKVGDQVHYQFTPEGLDALQMGNQKRKRMFPQLHVRPQKTATPLTGDVAAETKDYLGAVKKPAGQKILKQAINNMNQVPNVVDKQRAKILLSTILPVLSATSELDPTLADAFSEINNVGPSKQAQFDAAEAADPNEYNAAENMIALKESVAQGVRAVAQERNGANYLTYAIQAFNGRISPQQSTFDPSSSKAVRFVTRNAVPAVATPGSRVERNLRQMYAMMLVKGADDKLPPVREQMLDAATPQLAAWGKRLIEVLDATMSDAEYEQIAQAIADGKPLQDPAFQNLRPLALDPEADADLIRNIRNKGEDGPHFIDGLIDFAKYEHSKRAKKPYHSYFNAYMDGKTNGIASNAIQLGTEKAARQTGVLRDGDVSLLDDGDIREALKQTLLQEIEDNGWDGNLEGMATEFTLVGKAVAQHRDLNKHTTMTFGYGKDTDTFGSDIADAVGELEQIAIKAEQEGDTDTLDAKGLNGYTAALNVVRQNAALGAFVEAMTDKTDLGLRQVMSPEAIEARGIMRSAAVAHAMMNALFSIGTHTGFELNLGRLQSLAWDEGNVTEYDISKGEIKKRLKVGQYEAEPTAAAVKHYTDKTGAVTSVPGGHAVGGALPGPIQSLDAATVAMTVTGKSWDKLKSASRGNPYIHTIYDAFKVDAMGYDVVLDEVNKNWLDAGMQWSYLEETKAALTKAFTEFNDKVADPNRKLTDNERLYMDWALEAKQTQSGKILPMNLIKQLDKTDSASFDDGSVFKAQQRIIQKMADAGYDWQNPPSEPTARQLKAFVFAMRDEMNLGNRLGRMISHTNKQKAELGKKIKAGGVPVYQYYAH